MNGEIAYTLDDLRAMFIEASAVVASGQSIRVAWKATNRRTQEQNDKIQPMARDIAKQVQWAVAGNVRPMPAAKWRHFFAGHVRAESWMVPKIDGDGILILGVGTSELSVREASDCVELMYAFGGERQVVWSEQTKRLLK
jgi:hypothetical protein